MTDLEEKYGIGQRRSMKSPLLLLILVLGSGISYFFFNSLTLLVFLLLWIDGVILFYVPNWKGVGLEFITLSAIISGLALGPVAGFIFTLIGIPILITIFFTIGMTDFFPVPPNFNFVSMAIGSALAGYLGGTMSFLAVVLIALFFKHILSNIIDYAVYKGTNMAYSFVNLLFTLFFLYIIRETGLIAAFA